MFNFLGFLLEIYAILALLFLIFKLISNEHENW